MKLYISIPFFLFFYTICSGQNIKYNEKENPFAHIYIARDHIVNKTPYLGIKELHNINADSIIDYDIYNQALMTVLNVCGEIKEKNEIKRNRETSMDFIGLLDNKQTNLLAQSAKKFILEMADKYDITMINESHLYPEHRVFMKSLLKELYTKKYTTICFEDFRIEDETIYSKLNCPDSKNGFYIHEPNMGELMRHSLNIGYGVKSYDSSGPSRDSIAALKLVKIYKEVNPGEKIIVFCGHGHNQEKSLKKKSLAIHFTEMTK